MPGDYETLDRQLNELPRDLINDYLGILGTLQKLEGLAVPDLIKQGAEKRHALAREVLIRTIREREIFVSRAELVHYLISCAIRSYREERERSQSESDEGLKEAQKFNEGKLRGIIEKGLDGYLL